MSIQSLIIKINTEICNNTKEVVDLIDSQAKANLREWKERLLEEALENWVMKHHAAKWLKIRERKPTPWVCLRCGPQESSQAKRYGHYQRYLVVTEGTIRLRVPQLECLTSGSGVAPNALFLPKRRR